MSGCFIAAAAGGPIFMHFVKFFEVNRQVFLLMHVYFGRIKSNWPN